LFFDPVAMTVPGFLISCFHLSVNPVAIAVPSHDVYIVTHNQ
jgi:hypothetical protein